MVSTSWVADRMNGEFIANSPDEMFALGERVAASLAGGETVLLYGGLGAGKTLLTKGIMSGLSYDVDEVTSPSFSLVNLYRSERFDVYHIDLWRIETGLNVAEAVGLDEIFEDERTVTIIEWADRLGTVSFPGDVIHVRIEGDGDQARNVSIFKKTRIT